MTKLLKYVFSMLLVVALGYSFTGSASAKSGTYHLVVIDRGDAFEYEPIVKDGIQFVPLSAFAKQLSDDPIDRIYGIPANARLFETPDNKEVLVPDYTERAIFVQEGRDFEFEAKSFIKDGLVYVPLSFITAKAGLNLKVEEESYLDRKTLKYKTKNSWTPSIPIDSVKTGKTYPDGWTAPKLTAKKDDYSLRMHEVLKNELGFTDGLYYDLPGHASVIRVDWNTITHSMWERNDVKDSYRIPVVTLELLKYFFGNDAEQVLSYYDTKNLSEKPFYFIAGDMQGTITRKDGKTVLKFERYYKESTDVSYRSDYNHCGMSYANTQPKWNGQAFHKYQVGTVKVFETTDIVNNVNKVIRKAKKGESFRVYSVRDDKLVISSNWNENIVLSNKVKFTAIPVDEQFAMSCALGNNIEMPKASVLNGNDYVFALGESFTGVKKIIGVHKKLGAGIELLLTGLAKANAAHLVEVKQAKNAIYARDAYNLDVFQTSLKKPFASNVILKDVSHYEVLSDRIAYIKVERKNGKIVRSSLYTSDLNGKNGKLVRRLDNSYTFSPIFGFDANSIAVMQNDSKTGKNELHAINLNSGKITTVKKFTKGSRYSVAQIKMNGSGYFIVGIQERGANSKMKGTSYYIVNMKGAIPGKFKVSEELLSVHQDKGKFTVNTQDYMHGFHYNAPIQNFDKRNSLPTKGVAGQYFYKMNGTWYAIR